MTQMITIMEVPCYWALSPVTPKSTLETLIISRLQASVSLYCKCDSPSMTRVVDVDVKQLNNFN